jgi:hypothetical protein
MRRNERRDVASVKPNHGRQRARYGAHPGVPSSARVSSPTNCWKSTDALPESARTTTSRPAPGPPASTKAALRRRRTRLRTTDPWGRTRTDKPSRPLVPVADVVNVVRFAPFVRSPEPTIRRNSRELFTACTPDTPAG